MLWLEMLHVGLGNTRDVEDHSLEALHRHLVEWHFVYTDNFAFHAKGSGMRGERDILC